MKLDLMCDYAICNQTERCAGYNTRVGICNPILLLLVCPAEERGKKGGNGKGKVMDSTPTRNINEEVNSDICLKFVSIRAIVDECTASQALQKAKNSLETLPLSPMLFSK